MKKMPYKHTLSEVLLMLCANSPEAFRIIAIMAGGEFTRACLGSSNSHLKTLGRLVFLHPGFLLHTSVYSSDADYFWRTSAARHNRDLAAG
ncbi:hypothetical protein V4841_07040 [Lelliottia amnigena]|uniref:Uncharacterized protein n=1 Tax=Lelliottia amnigena TaxID=61646 RepID=A0ABU7U9X6_LELAM